MTKKIAAAALAVVCIAFSGCSNQKDNGGTGLDSESAYNETLPQSTSETTNATTTSATETASELIQTPEESVSESASAEEEPAITEKSTEETLAADVDCVALISAYDNEYLGLPEADKVYIFKDMMETEIIDGSTYYGVDIYDEDDGSLYYVCSCFISADGGTVYKRKAGVGNVLLPESAGFPALDPQTMTADEIFANAYYLSSICAGRSDVESFADVSQTITVEGVPGEWAKITDSRIDTKEKLLNAISHWFSMDIINALMENYNFTTYNDELYYCLDCVDMRSENYTSSEWELTELTEDEAVYTEYALFTYEAGETQEREYTYIAQKTDGVWCFTQFDMPWVEGYNG